MMKRAGSGIGGWIIGLVAVFVILFILGGNLFPQVKNALFGIAPAFGEEKAPEIISKPRTQRSTLRLLAETS